MPSTTINKLKKNKCYCSLKKKDISLKKCNGFQCSRWKKCMVKTNKDIDKDLKKQKEGNNAKKI